MKSDKLIAYYRVSTVRQGQSGLGLEAQKEAVRLYLSKERRDLLCQFHEVETGGGSDALNKRPQLKAALEQCRKHGATLIIAKLDRLARNVHFISGLLESRVRFIACDMPEASELTIHLMAAFAEHEAKRISERTKEALAIAKSRGVRLGVRGRDNLKPNTEIRQQTAARFVQRMKPLVESMTDRGLSQRSMVIELNEMGVPAPKGGKWRLVQLQRLLKHTCLGGD